MCPTHVFLFFFCEGKVSQLDWNYSNIGFREYWEHMMSLVSVKVRFGSIQVIKLNQKTWLICRLVIVMRLESILRSSISRWAGQSKIETWWVHSFFSTHWTHRWECCKGMITRCMIHQTQTWRGAKLGSNLLEGSGVVVCPTHSLYNKLHKLWAMWSELILYNTQGLT